MLSTFAEKTDDREPTTVFMTWVKICGITNLEDALIAVEAGADALGFVFYEKSPLNIDPVVALEIVTRLPEQTEKVGVFVNGAGFQPVDIAREVGLTAIQNTLGVDDFAETASQMVVALGGFARPPKLFLAFPASWIQNKVEQIDNLRARFAHLRRDSANGYSRYEGCFDTFFVDSSTHDVPGGTGKTFAWRKAHDFAEKIAQSGMKLVIAGGLNARNVSRPIRILRPWGVDVSSGVEAKPGKKDPEKVRAFIKAVREADKVSSN